jgi:N-acyl amino acid synthase of PEP-CTERM/exosortase system
MESAEKILESFDTKFKLEIATTSQLKEEAYRIRYQVYCEDLKYEPSDRFPEKMETDFYDEQSIILLLLHKESQSYAGCVRLIIPQPQRLSLPFELACNHKISKDIIDLNQLSRHSMFEVSRLAATSAFRKRKGESQTTDGLTVNEETRAEERRGFPMVPLSLYLGVLGIMLETNLEHLFTMMEPRLARHLKYVGFHFHQIGDLVNYHGRRGPFYIHRDGSQGLHPAYKPLQEMIRAEMRESLAQYGSDLSAILKSD